MILVDEFIKLNVTEEFWNMFLVVIQLGAILAVCLLFFHELNPFSPKKGKDGRRATWSLWGKIVLGCIPAAVIGIPLDDFMEEHLYSSVVVAAALIVYGIAFIVIESWRTGAAASFPPPVRFPDRVPPAPTSLRLPSRLPLPVVLPARHMTAIPTLAPSRRWTSFPGRPPWASAASRCCRSFPAPSALVPPSSAACFWAALVRWHLSSRSSWRSPSCSAPAPSNW